MKTDATETLPVIDWDDLKVDLIESDPDERMHVYLAYGYGNNGKKYTGTAYFFCDEFDHIDDIEEY